MTINTTIGKTYAVTSATECTITTPDGTLIATCQPGIQTCIIAPTTQIEISDPAALVTETFKGASAGSSAAGGVTPLRQTLHSTAAPRDNACPGIYLTAQHTGTIKTLSILSMKEKVHTGMPIWVKAYRILEDGSKIFICISSNKCQPDNTLRLQGGTYSWHFPPIPVTKGDRLALVSSGDYNKDKTTFQPEDQDIVWFDASIRDISESDDFIIKPDGSKAASALPEYSVTYSEISVNGVPIASNDDLADHTSDKTSHITAAERTAWNNKADASALSAKVNTSTFNAHTGNATAHITAEERTEWNNINTRTDELLKGKLFPSSVTTPNIQATIIECQSITCNGEAAFQDTVTCKTKANPNAADIMNKAMTDAAIAASGGATGSTCTYLSGTAENLANKPIANGTYEIFLKAMNHTGEYANSLLALSKSDPSISFFEAEGSGSASAEGASFTVTWESPGEPIGPDGQGYSSYINWIKAHFVWTCTTGTLAFLLGGGTWPHVHIMLRKLS